MVCKNWRVDHLFAYAATLAAALMTPPASAQTDCGLQGVCTCSGNSTLNVATIGASGIASLDPATIGPGVSAVWTGAVADPQSGQPGDFVSEAVEAAIGLLDEQNVPEDPSISRNLMYLVYGQHILGFDPLTRQFADQANNIVPACLPVSLYYSALAWDGESLFIFGGQDKNGVPTNTIYQYSPETGVLVRLPTVLPAPTAFASAVFHAGEFIIADGPNHQIVAWIPGLRPTAYEWQLAGAAPQSGTLLFRVGSRVLLAGASNGWGDTLIFEALPIPTAQTFGDRSPLLVHFDAVGEYPTPQDPGWGAYTTGGYESTITADCPAGCAYLLYHSSNGWSDTVTRINLATLDTGLVGLQGSVKVLEHTGPDILSNYGSALVWSPLPLLWGNMPCPTGCYLHFGGRSQLLDVYNPLIPPPVDNTRITWQSVGTTVDWDAPAYDGTINTYNIYREDGDTLVFIASSPNPPFLDPVPSLLSTRATTNHLYPSYQVKAVTTAGESR